MSQKSYNGTPTLYLVPTPIGNLEDITIRAINILKMADVIFSEDTRVTLNLLKYFEISKKVFAAHEHNENAAKYKMLEFLQDGKTIAFTTDRGTPIISDPGFKCVSFIIENGYNVVGLPGPTALIPALIVSGISPHPFLFYGFLNNKDSKKKSELKELKDSSATLIFYEAPHRLKMTLETIKEIFGNRAISISREISKTFEEIYRGTIDMVLSEINEPKGELVIVVEGNREIKTYAHITSIEHINLYIKEGYNEKDAIKLVAKERNINKGDLYKEYHTRK